MGALMRALMDSEIPNIETALQAKDITSQEMRNAIDEWVAAWFDRTPDPARGEDPCQRIPYAIVNKLCKSVFAEYDSSLADTSSAKLQWMDGIRQHFDGTKRDLLQWCMVGGEALLKPIVSGRSLHWRVLRRNGYIVLGRAPNGNLTDVALAEKTTVGDVIYTLVERRIAGQDGRLTVTYQLYRTKKADTLGSKVALSSLAQYADLPECYTFSTPIDGVGLVHTRLPSINCVDGSQDGISIYEPAMGLIHNINRNEYQLGREFELGRARVIASSDLLSKIDGKPRLQDDLFVGLDGMERSVGITVFAPELRNANYEQRRQAYLKAVENLLGIKRGILSDVEATDKTAMEIVSSAGDYALSIVDLQNMYYDTLQAALRLADQLGRAYGLCDAELWNPESLNVTWGNGVLYDADKEWTERKEMVQMGLLKPELALAWKYDLPCETDADLAFIRQRYMPELADLER